MKIILSTTYAFGFLLRSAGAFRSSSKPSFRQSTRTQSSLLDELTKSFSSLAGNNNNKYYTIGLTGSGGLIGTALRDELSQRTDGMKGKQIRLVCLKRSDDVSNSKLPDKAGECQLTWNPNASSIENIIDSEALKEMDAIVHLSGENISTGEGILAPLGIRPWTDSKKKEIVHSRVSTTSALAKAIASNKKVDFLVASGIGVYGKDFIGPSAEVVDESKDVSSTSGFLADVSRQWEAASVDAKKNGSRVVSLRNGVVLSKFGGALAKLYPIFFLGGGGIVGSGKQYFPFISARDMARAMIHVLETPRLEGPVNMCAPGACTNAEFTAAMGKVLGRPTLLPFPGFAVSLLFGEMGEEILLGGVRANPSKLLESCFQFAHPDVESAVQSAVDEKI